MKTWTRAALAIFACMAIATGTRGEGGIGGSGWLSGSLQMFASIFIDDREFDTDNAVVLINGAPGDVSDLRIGQQIALRSNAVVGDSADVVRYDASLIGPASGIDASAGTFRILGVGVSTFDGTNLDGLDLAKLRDGDWVEVSGVRGASGDWLATYARAAQAPFAVLSGEAGEQRSGKMLVDGVVVQTGRTASPLPATGDFVRIRGSLAASGSALVADVIEPYLQRDEASVDLALEGHARRRADGAIVVNGQRVRFAENTRFMNGTAKDLADGIRASFAGRRDGDGVLVEQVTFKPSYKLRLEGRLDGLQTKTRDSALLDIAGFKLWFNQTSSLGRGEDPQRGESALSTLSTGDYIRLIAFVDGAHMAIRRMEIASPKDEVRVLGLVSETANGGFKLMDRWVYLDRNTAVSMSGGDTTLTRFIAQLRPGSLVEVRWNNGSASGAAASVSVR
ncbi:MAG: DUF5666 domain-containing protein [Pseudomonadales bacterium]